MKIMKNKKVLFCSEASWLSTGYSVYTKEVLSRLRQIDGLEVAELSCYVDANDGNIPNSPWKIYPNKPVAGDAAYDSYKGNVTAQFGDQTFNAVMLDFQPDVVMDIRDWWMVEFQQRSPFRDFFHWAIMPTVDALPQANQWINTYATADSVFAYSEFGRFQPNYYLNLTKNDLTQKAETLNMYSTQMREGQRGGENLFSLARIRGNEIGLEYAEAFHIHRLYT